MARTSNETTTSLWSVIESMQRRLEAEGLDAGVVDVAVTRGLEALLEIAPPVRTRATRRARVPAPRIPTWFRRIAVAKA